MPDNITEKNIRALRDELTSIWRHSQSAIEIIQNKHESKLQSGLFGLIDDFGKALKIGFLIGDRVVLLDYLFDRLLTKKVSGQINKLQLGLIGNNIVELLPLAKKGRIVIIPNPFVWNQRTKKIIKEVSETSIMTPNLISMLNMLSICKSCHLHPYTIAESEDLYEKIINEQIDHADTIGKDGGQFAYEGILAALLSERLFDKTEFSYIKDIPISEYIEIISQHKNFYSEYLNSLSSGGSLSATNNIEKIRESFVNNVEILNSQIKNRIAKGVLTVGAIGSGAIALLAAFTITSAPLAIAGGMLGLSASLSGLINDKPLKEDIIISLFHDLKNNKH
ncbi:MAG: hypothetical protein K8R67_03765 [Desulfobacteraceae bacterium]|nr:hypothetical protein [Desulfobacteraceae bacterium]